MKQQSRNYSPIGPPSSRNNSSVQTYIPIDDDQTPPSLWRLLILAMLMYVLLSSIWVFSEYPGGILLNGKTVWTANQAWYAATHFGAIIVAALLTWLKR